MEAPVPPFFLNNKRRKEWMTKVQKLPATALIHE
jgi:hypothetical protein